MSNDRTAFHELDNGQCKFTPYIVNTLDDLINLTSLYNFHVSRNSSIV